jgi:hypothetical protein
MTVRAERRSKSERNDSKIAQGGGNGTTVGLPYGLEFELFKVK